MNDRKEADDRFARSVALTKALEFWAPDDKGQDSDILKTAELFRLFLIGEGEQPAPEETDPRPLFRLPVRDGSNYIYFQFHDSHIIYRADVTFGAHAGGVERLSTVYDTEWRQAGSSVNTRYKLRNNAEYNPITAAKAEQLIRDNTRAVRFE